MTTAVTPGRPLLPSIARAVEIGHPALVPREELIPAMAAQGYTLRKSAVREVADGKRLVGLLFEPVHAVQQIFGIDSRHFRMPAPLTSGPEFRISSADGPVHTASTIISD